MTANEVLLSIRTVMNDRRHNTEIQAMLAAIYNHYRARVSARSEFPKDVLRFVQGCSKSVSGVCKGESRVFQDCFKGMNKF